MRKPIGLAGSPYTLLQVGVYLILSPSSIAALVQSCPDFTDAPTLAALEEAGLIVTSPLYIVIPGTTMPLIVPALAFWSSVADDYETLLPLILSRTINKTPVPAAREMEARYRGCGGAT
jgi:hypothetical protein